MITILVILAVIITMGMCISRLCQEINQSIEDQAADTWDSGVYTCNGYVNHTGINRPIRR